MAGALQREIRQEAPFESIEQEVFLNLQRTAEVLIGELAEVLKALELTPTQYNVLRILRGAGPGGLPCREISLRMVTRDPDVTRLLDRIEARGLVERERLTTDRRVVLVRIAAGGLATLEAADPAVRQFVLGAMARIDADRLYALNVSLEALRGD